MSSQSGPQCSEQEYSAGGVLVRTGASKTQVCLVQIPTRGGNPSWRLPKGRLEAGETVEKAALRETREETGCHAEVLSPLTRIEYLYTRRDETSGERVRVWKYVDFFLMRYTHGELQDHDDEVEEARWFSFRDALQTLSYDAERRVLQEALHAWDAHLYRQGLSREAARNDF